MLNCYGFILQLPTTLTRLFYPMSKTLPDGIHHITAIAGDPVHNVRFIRDVLGLRLVKKTVNFDDPTTYHLYYGDETGRPGTILTFFPFAGVPQGRVGNGQVTATAFSIPEGSLDPWRERLKAHDAQVIEPESRFGQRLVRFYDPDGLPLELVEEASPLPTADWPGQLVAPAMAIRGFHSATLTVADAEATQAFLERWFEVKVAGTEGPRRRLLLGSGGASRTLDLVGQPGGRRGLSGAGTVHHLAMAIEGDTAQKAMRAALETEGAGVSPIMDRNYFHSIYFREPGGILLEVATNHPGFTVDEPKAELGQNLKLPEQYEPQRARLEASLPSLAKASS